MKNNAILAFALVALFVITPAFADNAFQDSGCDDCLAIHLSEEMVAEGYGSCPGATQDIRGYFDTQDTSWQADVEQSTELSRENGGDREVRS